VRFVDTNVLLYAISRDPAEKGKADRANAILDDGDIGLSVQVLQEFYVQSTRTTRPDALTHDQATTLVEAFLRFPTAATTVDVMRAACTTRERFGLSYWDAAILESSRSLGCEVVLTEDLTDGADYDGVRVENPFRSL
jgi:predicted nucleic acid-binding protein